MTVPPIWIEAGATAALRGLWGSGLIIIVLINIPDASGRYGGLTTPTGANQPLVFAMIWILMAGAMLATRDRTHQSIDLFFRRLTPRSRLALTAANGVVTAAVGGFAAIHSRELVERIAAVGEALISYRPDVLAEYERIPDVRKAHRAREPTLLHCLNACEMPVAVGDAGSQDLFRSGADGMGKGDANARGRQVACDAAPDRFNRHPVSRRVHEACHARIGIVPQPHVQRSARFRLTKILGMPMRKRRSARDPAGGLVRYRKLHGLSALGALDDARMGHVDISLRQRRRAGQRAEQTRKNRPEAAYPTLQMET